MRFRMSLTLAFAGVFAVAACPLHAAEITLDAAIRRTLEANPALRAEAAEVGALQSQAQLDGLAPAPTFAADLENVLGTGSVSGIHGAETTLRLGQVFELGGKRDARQTRGLAAVERQQNMLQQRRLDLVTETTRRFIAIAAGQQELALANRQWALARDTEAAVLQRVQRGAAAESDQALAQIAVVRAEIAHEHAEHELASARFALAALWGEARALAIEVSGDLLSLPELPTFESLAARIAATPEALAYELEANRLTADRRVASAEARPDVSLSIGVRRLEALDDQGLVMSFSMPFGSAERASYAVARTDAELSAVAARQQSAALEARQLLFARYQELRHARTEFAALSDRMLPAAEKGLALTQAGYDDARYSVLQLTQAQATLQQLQRERLDAAARYHQLLAEMERSTAAVGDMP